MTVTLNDDVMLEILQWFVSIDDIGPFTLFHICKTWRALLLRTPSLWTWIVVDMGVDDVEERVQTCIQMSGSLALHLRIKLQLETITSIPWLSHHLPRADLLIIELPGYALIDSSVFDLLPRVQRFIDSGAWSPNLRVVWLRDSKMESVKTNWLTSESWLVTKTLSSRALTLRNVFSTAAVVDDPIWTGPTRLQDVLLDICSLHNLRLSEFRPRFCDPERDSGARPEERVRLPHLRHVLFEYLGVRQPRIDYADEHSRVAATFLALQTDRVSIIDYFDGILMTIRSLAAHLQPTAMALYPRDALYTLPFKLTAAGQLRKLYKLQVSLVELSNEVLEDELSSMARGLASLLQELVSVCACALTVSSSTFPFALRFISLTPSTRQIIYKISVVRHPVFVSTASDSEPPPLFSTLPVVDCLEIQPSSISVYGQVRARQIVIDTPWNAYKVEPTLSTFISTPDGDYSGLERLDTGRVTFTQENLDDPPLPRLPSLTTLRCVPIVARHILDCEAAPSLRELTLVDDIYARDSHTPDFPSIYAVLARLGSKPLESLEALRWQFYPPWPALFTLYTTLCSRAANGAFQTALPSYPSRRILTSLVTALSGDMVEEDVLLKEEPWTFDEFTVHRTHRELCYYCFCSHRMDCKGNSSVACMRHSRETLVTITRFTLVS